MPRPDYPQTYHLRCLRTGRMMVRMNGDRPVWATGRDKPLAVETAEALRIEGQLRLVGNHVALQRTEESR
jgi:hypothetical protein